MWGHRHRLRLFYVGCCVGTCFNITQSSSRISPGKTLAPTAILGRLLLLNHQLQPISAQSIDERCSGTKNKDKLLSPSIIESCLKPNSQSTNDCGRETETYDDRFRSKNDNLTRLKKQNSTRGQPDLSDPEEEEDGTEKAHILKTLRKLIWMFKMFFPHRVISWCLRNSLNAFNFILGSIWLFITKSFGMMADTLGMVWDYLIDPLLSPFRGLIWLLVIKPIEIILIINRKLQPIIVLLLSAISFGLMIGLFGAFVHLSLSKALFPSKKPKIVIANLSIPVIENKMVKDEKMIKSSSSEEEEDDEEEEEEQEEQEEEEEEETELEEEQEQIEKTRDEIKSIPEEIIEEKGSINLPALSNPNNLNLKAPQDFIPSSEPSSSIATSSNILSSNLKSSTSPQNSIMKQSKQNSNKNIRKKVTFKND